MVVLSPQRRGASSPSAKTAVTLFENGRSIERDEIQANGGSLLIISPPQQFTRSDFDKDFQQESRSTIYHKDRLDLPFLNKRSAVDFHRCSGEREESRQSYGDRLRNDDYFPQGEEYEDEIGMEDYRSDGEPSRFDDGYDSFESSRGVGPSSRFIAHRVYPPSVESIRAERRASKTNMPISKGDAVEKLQTLIEKVTEFKRRVSRTESDATKAGNRAEERKGREITNEGNNGV